VTFLRIIDSLWGFQSVVPGWRKGLPESGSAAGQGNWWMDRVNIVGDVMFTMFIIIVMYRRCVKFISKKSAKSYVLNLLVTAGGRIANWPVKKQ
jgi:hypothetical protein